MITIKIPILSLFEGTVAEAYLVKNPKSDAYNFLGPLSKYLENGFTQYRDND